MFREEIIQQSLPLSKTPFRAGFVGLIGLPNAGKSTLANVLVEEKVSIVTSKPQTTRQRILGIRNTDQYQMIFVDSPGLVKSQTGINDFLKVEAQTVLSESDLLVAVLNLDADRVEDLLKVADRCQQEKKPWLIVMTKSDHAQVQRQAVLREKVKKYEVPVVAVSALHHAQGTREFVLPLIEEKLPWAEGPFYDPEFYTNQTMREMVGEIIREKSFECLHQEIPYGLAVRVVQFKENEGRFLKIMADIIVSKEGHRPIVLGKGGSQLKKIGQASRLAIETLTERPVYLELFVAVKRNWMKDGLLLEELGYVNRRS